MVSLLFLAPLFLAFEVWQLFIAERYLGIKQIARHGDPRSLGLGEFTAFCWSGALLFYGLWLLLLLTVPFARIHSLGLMAIWLLGYSLRRNATIKWVLVILTFEGAVRVGLLIGLSAVAWRQL